MGFHYKQGRLDLMLGWPVKTILSHLPYTYSPIPSSADSNADAVDSGDSEYRGVIMSLPVISRVVPSHHSCQLPNCCMSIFSG